MVSIPVPSISRFCRQTIVGDQEHKHTEYHRLCVCPKISPKAMNSKGALETNWRLNNIPQNLAFCSGRLMDWLFVLTRTWKIRQHLLPISTLGIVQKEQPILLLLEWVKANSQEGHLHIITFNRLCIKHILSARLHVGCQSILSLFSWARSCTSPGMLMVGRESWLHPRRRETKTTAYITVRRSHGVVGVLDCVKVYLLVQPAIQYFSVALLPHHTSNFIECWVI